MKRSSLLNTLSTNILGIQHDRPLLVAVDGRDAAGRTTLAKELAEKLREQGAQVIELSIDGFHNPRELYRKGSDSSEGYYRDSFNLEALKNQLLDPPSKQGICVIGHVFLIMLWIRWLIPLYNKLSPPAS